jgi:hypothetical protein
MLSHVHRSTHTDATRSNSASIQYLCYHKRVCCLDTLRLSSIGDEAIILEPLTIVATCVKACLKMYNEVCEWLDKSRVALIVTLTI